MSNSFSLRFDAAGGKVLFDHERDLEGDGVVELAQVEARELLDLLETVDERISVDEQLSRRFGEDEVVLEELVDREERLLVERVDGVLLEDLLQEHFAQCRRQLINEAADAEVFIADDVLLGVEDLADLDRHLRFLIGLREVAQVRRHRADTDDHGALTVHAQRLFDLRGGLFKVAHLHIVAELLHEHHIVLAHGKDKARLPVGEDVLHGLDGDSVGLFVRAADDEHAAVELGLDVQLLGADVDIA